MADYDSGSISIVYDEKGKPICYLVNGEPCDLIQIAVDTSCSSVIEMKPLGVFHFIPHGKRVKYGSIINEMYHFMLAKGLVKAYMNGCICMLDDTCKEEGFLEELNDFYRFDFYPLNPEYVSKIVNSFVKIFIAKVKEPVMPVEALPLEDVYMIENLEGPLTEQVMKLACIQK